MAFLDALPGQFHTAFAWMYRDGTLRRRPLTQAIDGKVTEEAASDQAIKVQVDALTERQSEAEGATALDVNLIVLAYGVATPPNADDYVIADGRTYRVAPPIQQDPGKTHWTMRGVIQNG